MSVMHVSAFVGKKKKKMAGAKQNSSENNMGREIQIEEHKNNTTLASHRHLAFVFNRVRPLLLIPEN